MEIAISWVQLNVFFDLSLTIWTYSFDLVLLDLVLLDLVLRMLNFRKYWFLWRPFAVKFFDKNYLEYNLL